MDVVLGVRNEPLAHLMVDEELPERKDGILTVAKARFDFC